MKRYHVETTPDSDYDLSRHFDHIYTNLQNEQAAFSFLDDYDETIETLADHAATIKESDNAILRERNLRRINFQRNRYFLLFSTQQETVTVVAVGHFLQDIENVLH